jgi:hypothetical protein
MIGLHFLHQAVDLSASGRVIEISHLERLPGEQCFEKVPEDGGFGEVEDMNFLTDGFERIVPLRFKPYVVEGAQDDLVVGRQAPELVEGPQLVALFEGIGKTGQYDDDFHPPGQFFLKVKANSGKRKIGTCG